jgi:hypothetical protein
VNAVIEKYMARYLTCPHEVTKDEIEEWAKAGITHWDLVRASEANDRRKPELRIEMARAHVRSRLLAKDPQFWAWANLQVRREKTLHRLIDGIVCEWDNPYSDPGSGGWKPLEV